MQERAERDGRPRAGRSRKDSSDPTSTPSPTQRPTIGNAAVGRVLRSAEDDGIGGRPVADDVGRALQQRQGRGSALPDDVRGEMEHALGADLRAVKVHADDDAHRLSRSVGAKAFTSGTDVYFTKGRFSPASRGGKELLAHELAHVVQQQQGTSGLAGGHVSSPGDGAEREAARIGKAVADGAVGGATSAAPTPGAPMVRRDVDDHGCGRGCDH